MRVRSKERTWTVEQFAIPELAAALEQIKAERVEAEFWVSRENLEDMLWQVESAPISVSYDQIAPAYEQQTRPYRWGSLLFCLGGAIYLLVDVRWPNTPEP